MGISKTFTEQRRRVLYNTLLNLGDKWMMQEDLLELMQDYYPNALCKDMHNSTARRMLSADIQAINSNSDYDKLILSGSKGIKLATHDECVKYFKNQYRAIFAKLKRTRVIQRKAASDGQFLLIEGLPIDSFINSFERSNG
jgi:hypothetical protein